MAGILTNSAIQSAIIKPEDIPMLNLRMVLCPTDFSACSQHAFRLATALARDHGARLHVMHVATPSPFVSHGELERALDRPEGYRQELERQMRQMHAAEAPLDISYRVMDGDPATEILNETRQLPGDLIVMGTHGRTGLGRLLMGSVAERVLREAPCPVVTVKVP